MAVNDNKVDFMGAVSAIAMQYRSRSFESCMNGFMKSMISHCASVDIPKGLDIGVKEKVVKTVRETISKSAKEITKGAFDVNDEGGALFDVDVAHEIETPQNLNESVQKLLAQHIYDESKDRAEVLAAEFDAGAINNLTEVQAVEHINNMYDNDMFDVRFDNGRSFKKGMEHLLSFEGEMIVDEIKDDISDLVSETEAKNSIIREAVAAINSKKADIEKKINGASESPTDDASKDGDHNDPDSPNSNKVDDDEGTNDDTSTDEGNSDDSGSDGSDDASGDDAGGEETSSEGWFVDAKKRLTKGKTIINRDTFFRVTNSSYAVFNTLKPHSTESLNLDENSFSREAAEQILDQFRKLEDGIDADSGDNSDNVLSVSNNEQKTNNNDPDAASAESSYDDDENEITVDESKFEYEEINPTVLEGENEDKEDLSEEAMAKEFFPLNLAKAFTNKIHANKRLPVLLACQPDGGENFFSQCKSRHHILKEIMSREDIKKIDPVLTSDEVATKLDKDLDICTAIEKDTKVILEDMGILGILGDKYQRTDSHVDNALISLFNANILSPMGKDEAGKDLSVSTEELYEHDLAEIFKNVVKKADLTMDLASNDINVVETKNELGYIDEIINEKLYSVVKPEDKNAVEEKVKTLYSLECICPIKDIATIKAFVSSENPEAESSPKVLLDTLKDIDGYGFSYLDTVADIKKQVKSKFEEVKDDKTNFNFDTDTLVDMVLEQQDTTKFEANMFEKTLSKLCENNTIENATEGLIIRNKAKATLTSFICAEKLGFLRDKDIHNYIVKVS